ncbi:hypothetical protein TVAG_420340 [Trichomonas vaginalis G3]|uniref:Uncharacterized protein n=1 Tax=Trichomonas vaginalis (strain ATCC PRA-98 / G3) TaxID=412133 RepID=A2ED57_TRIV3|nr:protein ubiquitination [Trichomonas vaginalis G3]EAY09412.1 hypothetical protein TVAG_420340 [Trichomonas vaginalis G3]KAI5536332.1 protein ubiquitination [Trichomonas vaginalis G3]|eukprot:XP_001321635.1 hypothetical protein [Trichomonas vaginalis G3]
MYEKIDEFVGYVLSNDYKSLKKKEKSISIDATYYIQLPTYSQNREPGTSLLHLAAFANSLECVIMLLKRGFDIFKTDTLGRTPLNLAALGASVEVMSFILRIYAKENKLEELFRQCYKLDNMETNLIISASNGGCVDIFRLFEIYGFKLYSFSKQSKTICDICIERLAKNSHIEALKYVLDRIADDGISSNDKTPIMTAIINRNFEAAKVLIPHSDLNKVTKDNKTVLSYACFIGNAEMAKNLIPKIDFIDIPKDVKSKGAAHWICQLKDVGVARMVLERGIDVNRRDENNNPCVSDLIIRNSQADEESAFEILKMLIQYGFDIHATVPEKPSILEIFVLNLSPQPQIIDYLLSLGADANKVCETYGMAVKKIETIKEKLKGKCRNPQIAKIYQKYFGQK